MLRRPPKSPPFPSPPLSQSEVPEPLGGPRPEDGVVGARVGDSRRQLGVEIVSRPAQRGQQLLEVDRKSTRLNSSHANISYAVFCLKKNNCHEYKGIDDKSTD